jgi:hypothetical protein
LAKQAQDGLRSVHYGPNDHLHDGVTLADKDTGHPQWPRAAAVSREAPMALCPGDVAQDVDIDVVGYCLDVVPPVVAATASATCLLVHHSSASVPICTASGRCESVERTRSASPAFCAFSS